MLMKQSRITNQGTAMPEATLCFEHFTEGNIRKADKVADTSDDTDTSRRCADSTDNSEVHCVVCGAE